MSASLVGSEMCIRHRVSAEKTPEQSLQHYLRKDEELTDKLFTLDAVSYTHLTLPTICSV
eukprot:12988608-Alexandrium_andersonii.AAC.1